MATAFESWHLAGGSADYDPTGHWNESESVFVIGDRFYDGGGEGGVRWMCDPTRDGRSRDDYAERYIGPKDFEGVHLNSGIGNLMFCLLARGGVHPRGATQVQNRGVGTEIASKVVYTAQAHYWGPHTNFDEAVRRGAPRLAPGPPACPPQLSRSAEAC